MRFGFPPKESGGSRESGDLDWTPSPRRDWEKRARSGDWVRCPVISDSSRGGLGVINYSKTAHRRRGSGKYKGPG